MSDIKETADVVEEADRPDSAGADSPTPVAKNGKEKKYHIGKHAFTKGGFIGIIVVAVIVVAGIGMYAWHTTPGFCGTVCHTSMNKYVETYNSGNKGMLSVVHKEAGKNCLDCHNPKVTEQVSEVMVEWSGEYAMDSEGYVVMDDTQMASKEFCLKSGCHDSWDKVVQATEGAFTDASGRVYNPHSSHQDGSITCGDCHKSHKASTLYCAKCHAITDMPEGWEATSD